MPTENLLHLWEVVDRMCSFADNKDVWLSGFFDRGSFVETLDGWAKTVVCGRARYNPVPLFWSEYQCSKGYWSICMTWSITYDFICFVCVGWVAFPWESLPLRPEQSKLSFQLILEILTLMPRCWLNTVHFISELILLVAAWVVVGTFFSLSHYSL